MAFKSILITCLLLFTSAFSQPLLGPVQLQVPPFEKDKKGNPVLIDYATKLSPFTDKKLSLSSFKNENLLIFYFSARCGHCKAAYPHVKKLYAELKKKNIKMAAIAISQNSEPDIAQFITEFGVDVPVFHDVDRKFSRDYGTGNVPLIILVNKKGEFMKFTKFNPSNSIDEINFAFADKSKF